MFLWKEQGGIDHENDFFQEGNSCVNRNAGEVDQTDFYARLNKNKRFFISQKENNLYPSFNNCLDLSYINIDR